MKKKEWNSIILSISIVVSLLIGMFFLPKCNSSVSNYESVEENIPVYSFNLTVYDHVITSRTYPPGPPNITFTIPNMAILSCRLELTAHSDPDDRYIRSIHFYIDGRGGSIGTSAVGPGQVIGDTISPGQTVVRNYDLSHVKIANLSAGLSHYYLNYIPQSISDRIGYLAPGNHSLQSFITTWDSYLGAVKESWVSITLYFNEGFPPHPGVSSPPQMEGPSVVPRPGDQDHFYNFSVVYFDQNNDAPSFIHLNLNGTSYPMFEVDITDTCYTDGCLYSYSVQLNPGTYYYSFECSDGVSENFIGPFTLKVNVTPPRPPLLLYGSVTTCSDTTEMLFNFSVLYLQDADRAPTFVNVNINGSSYQMVQVDPTDSCYTDGACFSYLIQLMPGTYSYYFICSDGLNSNSTPFIRELVVESCEDVFYLNDWTVPPNLEFALFSSQKNGFILFNFENTGNSTFVHLNFTIEIPEGWTATNRSVQVKSVASRHQVTVLFEVQAPNTAENLLEEISIHFETIIDETGETYSDSINVVVTITQQKKYLLLLLILFGFTTSIAVSGLLQYRNQNIAHKEKVIRAPLEKVCNTPSNPYNDHKFLNDL
ncbi:MAG: NEW3 domain-containing protein [Candidatus Helarchaeota archaeon]